MTWRVGKKVGRTLYRSAEGGPGALIGVMDKVEDAVLASAAPDLLEACGELVMLVREAVALGGLDAIREERLERAVGRAEQAISDARKPWEPTR